MNLTKFTIGLSSALGVIVLLGAGCTNKVATLTGQATNETKCIELTALSMLSSSYGLNQNMAGLEKLQQKVDDLKKEYNWSGDDYLNHCKQYANQKSIMDRVGKRMQELIVEIK
jgi:hypothetical protein